MFCNKCGTGLPDDSEFCHKCGTKLARDKTPPNLHNNNEKYCVTLDNAGSRKVEVIKVVRELTGLGLAEAKDLVDNAPKPLKAGLTKMEAESIKSSLESVGATAILAISDAEQIVYQDDSNKGDKPKSSGCLTSVLSPFIATITVASLLLFGLAQPVTLGGLAILLIVAIISVISTIKEKTKNPKKLIVTISVVAIVAVVAIVVSLGGRVDYIETVKAYRPYTNWGYNQTYQEVLSHFISDLNWSYEKAGDGAEVIAQGTSPLYGNTEIVISVIPIPGENNLFAIDPMSVTAGSEKSIGPMVQLDLLGMFGAYAQGSDWGGVSLPIQSTQPFQGTGASGGSASGMAEMDIYFVQRDESLQEQFQPMLTLHQDGNFTFLVNLLAGMDHYYGTYEQTNNIYTFYVTDRDNSMGFSGDVVEEFSMELDGDKLIYLTDEWLGMTTPGTIFYRTEEISSSTSNWDKVLYKNEPIMNWMGAGLASLRDVFGNPDVEGVVGEGGAYGFRYEDIIFIKRDQGEDIININVVPSSLSVDGITLDTSRDQLASLFGEPENEDWGNNYGDEAYYMQFIYQGIYSIQFYLDDPNGKAYEFWISYADDGISDDEYWDNANNSESSSSGKSNNSASGTYTMTDISQLPSSSGNVYRAPTDFVLSTTIGYVNITNPGSVTHNCKIQITTKKNALGMYEHYQIDEDGIPGGTVYTVVDARVVD